MRIEVLGAGFSNKGAELMLRTLLGQLHKHDPSLRVCLEPGGTDSFGQLASLGLEQVFPGRALLPSKLGAVVAKVPELRRAFHLSRYLLPNAATERLGLVPQGGADGLIDIQGYAYGDKFGPVSVQGAAVRAKLYAQQGKPVILLPQMLGPFENSKVRAGFRTLAESADVIYARDAKSFDCASDVLGTSSKLRRAPDITIFSEAFEGAPPDLPQEPFACIVPNMRLLDSAGGAWSGKYMDRLQAAALRVQSAGLVPLVVVHETVGGDERLARELAAHVSSVEVWMHEHPAVLKAAIARSEFLIGSRFHSIVAALSSGVPAIALGWAHKYPELLADFGVPQLIHQSTDESSHLISLIDSLLDAPKNAELRAELRLQKQRMKVSAESMWADVLGRLDTATARR